MWLGESNLIGGLFMESLAQKFYLVRTLPALVEKSIVGVGWSGFDFSKMETAEQAIASINAAYGIGRWANQIRRFFAIRQGDVVVSPMPYTVAIGRAEGAIFFDESYADVDRVNQRRVHFPRGKDGKILTIPRASFSEAFQRRIRVQGMTVNDLTEFGCEIQQALESLESGGIYSWTSIVAEEVAKKEEFFKKELLANIQAGKTNLRAGGIGLEKLVKELLMLDGYRAEIMSKRALGSYADADVKASRTDKCVTVQILVQVKHHQGQSGIHGIKQLEEIRRLAAAEYSDHDLVFVTSASVDVGLIDRAGDNNITVIDGYGLVDWIAEKIDRLSPGTKQALGICEVPTVVQLRSATPA